MSVEWTAPAVVLEVRPHGEGGAVVTLMTGEHGRHAGLAKGGGSRAQAGLWLPGNLVDRDGTALPKSGSVYTMLDNDGVRRFLLTLDRPTNVRLDAISGQVDTVLRVVGGDVELTDDDGGNDTNARLEEALPAGHYTVEVSSLSNGAGMVEVRVQVDGASADGAAASAASAAADAAAAAADDAAAVEAASR